MYNTMSSWKMLEEEINIYANNKLIYNGDLVGEVLDAIAHTADTQYIRILTNYFARMNADHESELKGSKYEKYAFLSSDSYSDDSV